MRQRNDPPTQRTGAAVMLTTTGTSGPFNEPLTFEEIKAKLDSATKAFKEASKPNEWLLMSPAGEMYVGTADQLTPILLKDHSLLKPKPFAPFDYQEF
jgi:hypothetical protein